MTGGKSFSVRVPGRDVTFACVPGETVLQAMARSSEKPLSSGCLGGGCGVCRVRVNEGDWEVTGPISADHVSPQDMKAGIMLACKLRPLSDIVLDPFGRMPWLERLRAANQAPDMQSS